MAGRSAVIDPDGLTVLERAFVNEVLTDPSNITDCLRRAGSTARNMRAAAHNMSKRPKVRAALAKARAKIAKRTEITAERVLYELWKRGTTNILDFGELQEDGTFLVNLSEIDREIASAIQEVSFEQVGTEIRDGNEVVPVRKVKIKLADSIRALELVGKHLGMFPTNVKGRIAITHTFEDALKEVFGDDGGSDGNTDELELHDGNESFIDYEAES